MAELQNFPKKSGTFCKMSPVFCFNEVKSLRMRASPDPSEGVQLFNYELFT